MQECGAFVSRRRRRRFALTQARAQRASTTCATRARPESRPRCTRPQWPNGAPTRRRRRPSRSRSASRARSASRRTSGRLCARATKQSSRRSDKQHSTQSSVMKSALVCTNHGDDSNAAIACDAIHRAPSGRGRERPASAASLCVNCANEPLPVEFALCDSCATLRVLAHATDHAMVRRSARFSHRALALSASARLRVRLRVRLPHTARPARRCAGPRCAAALAGAEANRVGRNRADQRGAPSLRARARHCRQATRPCRTSSARFARRPSCRRACTCRSIV